MNQVSLSIDQLNRRWELENSSARPVLRPELVSRRKHKPDYIGSMYLHRFTNPVLLRERIALAIQALQPWKRLFDAIAYSGMSGALIGPPVALAMNKEMIMVRKKLGNQRTSHSSHMIEGDSAARTYIILDDFIDSGKTRNHIKSIIRDKMPDAEYLGTLQVNHLEAETLRDFERRAVPYPLSQ